MKSLLETLPVLVFDCQASGPNPQKGFLLEMAWETLHHSDAIETESSTLQSCLIKSPPNAVIPWPVRRLTGITISETVKGVDEKEAWHQLLSATKLVHRQAGDQLCPVIIHYSRFEEPYLHHLQRTYSPSISFPFDIFCTHQIARRLWPDLPRRGLRALAGYLGYSVEELRRSSHHVSATSWIWNRIKFELKNSANVLTAEELRHWLNSTKVPKRGRTVYPMEKEKRMKAPDEPGVYRMLRSNGDVLYIGKATSLKQRVNSYFQKQSGHTERTLEMLSQAADIKFKITSSALEAALLETDEIKEVSPPYNKALKQGDREIGFTCNRLREFSDHCSSKFRVGRLIPSSVWVESFTLEDLIRHGTRLIRRAAWFCLLSESILIWQKRETNSDQRNYAVLSRGRIVTRKVLKKNETPPNPTSHYPHRLERMQQIDIPCYDRLRVLTTELKRLAKEKRLQCLRLGPHLRFDLEKTMDILKWF